LQEVRDIRLAWNNGRFATINVRENFSASGPGDHVLNHAANLYTRFWIGRSYFRTAGSGLSLSSRLANSDLYKYRGCFFERRTDVDVLNCGQRRTVVGLIDSVFEISATGCDGEVVYKRCIKVHMLKPYEKRDPYRFAERL
jgi:hypothetical protein